MASVSSEQAPAGASAPTIPAAVKILVAGGFGAGKTTLVGTVSEIPPLCTEEVMTEASLGVDDLDGVEQKTTTTVALDFGRITVDDEVVLYLFGTPGQGRFWFMWDELARGALGAVVLADTRRLDTCFPSVDFFEERGMPFVIAVNRFDGDCPYTSAEIRAALDVGEEVDVLMSDARDREAGKNVLITLVEQAIRRNGGAGAALD